MCLLYVNIHDLMWEIIRILCFKIPWFHDLIIADEFMVWFWCFLLTSVNNFVSIRIFQLIPVPSFLSALQFMTDGSESVFKFGVDLDVIQPNTTQTVIIHFKPIHPINYFKRVACLVQNQVFVQQIVKDLSNLNYCSPKSSITISSN